jgi:1-deoxy-D-xylulose-5-phosphate reductoisomerase
MKRLVVLGSTGSVGENTLRLIEGQRSEFQIVGLAANRNAARLLEQARAFDVPVVALGDAAAAAQARSTSGRGAPRVLAGPGAILELLGAVEFDLAVQAITGAAGLPSSHECLRLGKPLALANKESLVIAGELLSQLSATTGAPILPVDSEHSAVYQCVRHEPGSAVRRIYLTASGGPFRDRELDRFESITPEEALRHPNWSMGERITLDSATMMNKAFEIIEAHHLFGLRADQISVLVHRQSIVHSMVVFDDGSMLAQLGIPDMRVPIQVALHHPRRGHFALEPFDPAKFSSLTFSEPDPKRYPALALGPRCLELGGTAGAILNAADEIATQRFLAGEISFPEIARLCAEALEQVPRTAVRSLEQVWEADARGRAFASAWRSTVAGSRR